MNKPWIDPPYATEKTVALSNQIATATPPDDIDLTVISSSPVIASEAKQSQPAAYHVDMTCDPNLPAMLEKVIAVDPAWLARITKYAFSCARSDLETFAYQLRLPQDPNDTTHDPLPWYDIAVDGQAARELLTDALEILKDNVLIDYHPEFTDVVRIKKEKFQ